MDFERVVRKRRMIRAFKPMPVPEDKVRRIIALARHYPSAGFSQGVAFILVTEPERVQRLRELNRLRGDAPVLIVPCVSEKLYHDRYHESDKLRPDGTEIDWPIPYWHFDAGCASLLILLGAVNEGLSAYLAGAFRPDLLRQELGIPDYFVPVGVISIGYPDYERHVPSPSLDRGRRPSSQVIHSQKW
jgi:nitroreductase